MKADIPSLRMRAQGISPAISATPAEVVRRLGAIQAQDYAGSLWAIGVRLPVSTEDAVERAIADASIVRTWPLRGTLHFVAAEDARWILRHFAPRVISSIQGRYRRLELDEVDFRRAGDVVTRALNGGKQGARRELYALLHDAGISTAGQRGIHVLQRLALEGLICFGPREGSQQTVVLMDEWLPPAPEIERDEALARLARRYFTGHRPATERDFAWWAGLALADVRRAVSAAGPALATLPVDGTEYLTSTESSAAADESETCHLLPPFDEYLVGYTDRSAVLDPAFSRAVNNGGGLLAPTVLIDGRVAGTWSRVLKPGGPVEVTVSPFTELSPNQREAVEVAAARYASFLARPLRLVIDKT